MNARTESTKPSSSPPYSAPDTLCARHSQRECLAPHSILVCIPHNDTTQPITAHHYAASICAGYARPPGVVTGDWFVLEATWAPVRAAGRVRAAVGVHLDPHICHSAPEGVQGTSVKPSLDLSPFGISLLLDALGAEKSGPLTKRTLSPLPNGEGRTEVPLGPRIDGPFNLHVRWQRLVCIAR